MDVNLVLFGKSGSQRNFPLPSAVTVIGRRRRCDLCIPLTSVSRRHCQLNQDDGMLKVRDLGSRNGTILNGKRIDEAVVQPGDSIRIGPLTFVLQIDGRPDKIAQPVRAAQKPPPQDALKEEPADDRFGSAIELEDDFDSLPDDDLDSLADAFDSLEEDNGDSPQG